MRVGGWGTPLTREGTADAKTQSHRKAHWMVTESVMWLEPRITES